MAPKGENGYRPILLKNSDLPELAGQIVRMRRQRLVGRPAAPTAFEVELTSLCVALEAIDAKQAARDLHLNVGQPLV
jgi:hypothetical protein